MRGARRYRKLAAEILLVDGAEPPAAARKLAEDAEHALLGAIDDLDGAALVEDAVLGVARFLGAQQRAVADPGHLDGPGAARHVKPDLRRLAMGFGVPFGRHRDQFAVGVASGDVGEHHIGQHARVVELLAPRLDGAGVGEVAQHLFEGGAIRILETEGAGDLAGADLAGFLADEGEQVLPGREGGMLMGLRTQICVQKVGVAPSNTPRWAAASDFQRSSSLMPLR